MSSTYNDLFSHLLDRSSGIWTKPAPPTATSRNQETPVDRIDDITKIYADFIQTLKYCPEKAIEDSNITYQSLLSEFEPYNTGGSWFPALCRESSTIAELCYPNNSPEVRLRIARFTWYLIYVDDLRQKFPGLLEGFQKGLLASGPSEGTFLQDLREHLLDIYDLWDPIPANIISSSAMDFVSGCLLEQMQEIRDMKISSRASSWPYYLRTKTGSAGAYSCMMFPKELNINLSDYIQVLDDIALFTNLTNDILSFYKEDLAGETNNYIYNRAYVSQRSIPETLQDTVNETLDAHRRITEVLRSTEAYTPWVRFVNGYLAFHHTLKRYRLGDLGLEASY